MRRLAGVDGHPADLPPIDRASLRWQVDEDGISDGGGVIKGVAYDNATRELSRDPSVALSKRVFSRKAPLFKDVKACRKAINDSKEANSRALGELGK
jgi:hypothetical protein